MSVDYSAIASNSALLATVLTPLVGYVNRESKTRFLDLLAVPFTIFLLDVASSLAYPGLLSVWLLVVGVAVEIVIYLMVTIEGYYFEQYRLG